MISFRQWQEKDFDNTDYLLHIYPPEFWEKDTSYTRRMEQFPEGCWACVDADDKVVGYMFGHPWAADSIVPFDCHDIVIPSPGGCYYLHDVAVLPEYRKMGIARKFLEIAIGIAKKHGYEQIRGVSVLGSLPCWQKLGFVAGDQVGYGKGQKGTIVSLSIDKEAQ